ncbi:MAG: hypothetical protein LUH02_07720 [Erysipelotrichaceae bacterium]|nr:hypothetical protein [Erysipelotrichaceae bacterium]
MIQNFYIGSVKLIYHLKNEIKLQMFDDRFINPVLLIKNEINITLNTVNTINAPTNNKIYYQLPNTYIVIDNNKEYRYYIDKNDNPLIMSCIDSDMNITVNILKSKETEIMKKFRPWFNIHIERLLLKNDALILHSASIIYQNKAILFTAPSETGKSTQADLWHDNIDGVSDLNGDRTLLQKTDDGWFACGYPIHGGSIACEQIAVPFKAIVIIRQAKKDKIIELSTIEKISLLYSECTIMRCYEEDINEAINLLEELVKEVKVIKLECTKEASAVETLYSYLYGE